MEVAFEKLSLFKESFESVLSLHRLLAHKASPHNAAENFSCSANQKRF